MLHINVTILTILVGTALPLLNGIFAKEKSEALRVVLQGLLSAVAGALTIAIVQGGNVAWQGWLLSIAVTWGASILAFHGFWDPTGLVDRWVEFAAKYLAKVGIVLTPAEEMSAVDLLKALFGDAIQFISAEEAKLLGKDSPVPVAPPVVPQTPAVIKVVLPPEKL